MTEIVNGNSYGQSHSSQVVAVGAGVGSALLLNSIMRNRVNGFLLRKDDILNTGVNSDTIRTAMNTALKKTGMQNKGVKIIDFAKYDLNKSVESSSCNITSFTELLEKIKKETVNSIKKQQICSAKQGLNSYYFAGKYNKILTNTNKQPLAVFHEIGHSINENSSKLWKSVAKCRNLSVFGPLLVGAIALTTPEKQDGEKTSGVIDSTTSFIKKNATTLTLASFVPMLAEELKASQRGNKLAKELLSPELAKKVLKYNRYGAATYIVGALAATTAVAVGTKVKDWIYKC